MLLLGILLLPVVMSADREWKFRNYVIETNEKKALTTVRKTSNELLSLDLNLSSLGLKTIDVDAFANVTNVKRLNLADNWLSAYPKQISKLASLEYLSLADNLIPSLDKSAFVGLDNLETLDLSNNQLKSLREGNFHGISPGVDIYTGGNAFSEMSTLLFEAPESFEEEEMNLDKDEVADQSETKDLATDDFTAVKVCIENKVLKLVEVIKSGESLRANCYEVSVSHKDLKLSLRSLGFTTFEKGWYRVEGLPIRAIDFGKNKINKITKEILNDLPESVVEVDLSENDTYLSIIPAATIVNPHLRSLTMDKCFLYGQVHADAFRTNLTYLSMNEAYLRDITFIKNQLSLVEIRLSGNELKVISADTFSTFRQLAKLDLSFGLLTKIEQGAFRNSKGLRELNLFGNRLDLYKGVFADLESLEYLNIGSNRLGNLKRNHLFGLPDSLATVVLDSNEIESLEVGSFVRVPKHRLSLEGNNITRIPEGTFDLPTLRELNLRSNQLSDFGSYSFKGVENVERLSLADNRLTNLESGVLRLLTNLKILDLSSNRITVLQKGALFGMVQGRNSSVLLSGVPLQVIQSTVFCDTV